MDKMSVIQAGSDPVRHVEVWVEIAEHWPWRDRLPSEAVWQQWFECWLNALSINLSPIQQYGLGLQLTGDPQIRQLNGQYRDRDQSTDVLAFAALETAGPQVPELLTAEPLYLGDLVISLDTAQAQAHEQQHSLNRELQWLATHGVLHILGWDNTSEDDMAEMLAQQRQLVTQLQG